MRPMAGSLRKCVTEAVLLPSDSTTEERGAFAMSYSITPSSVYSEGETSAVK